MKTIVLTITTGLVLMACSPREETRSVDYYKEHSEERTAKLKECADNPGEKRKTPNCINAMQAHVQWTLSPSK